MQDPMLMTYTVGVQRWPTPFFKRFKVHGHTTQEQAGMLRLFLTCADGSVLAIPALHRRRVKVYPDYNQEKARVDAYQARVKQAAEASQAPV